MKNTEGGKKSNLFEKTKVFSRRRRLWIAVALIVGTIGLWGVNSCKSRMTAGQDQMVNLAKVTRGPIEVSVSGTGTVKPCRRWELAPRSAGEVVSVLVQPGQSVKTGQPLVELDTRELAIKADDAALELEQARLAYYDLEKSVAGLTVKSDSEGVMTGLSVKMGQSIPENYLLCTVQSSKMEVKAYFNTNQAKDIVEGQEATVFFIELLSGVPGTVTHVSESGVAKTGGVFLYPVTIEIENKGALMPGMSASVEVSTSNGAVKAPETTNEVSCIAKEVRSKAGGTVRQIFASDGDRVQAGKVLLALENEGLKTQAETQRLRLRRAETHLESIQDDLASQTVKAPEDCTVLDVKVREGDKVAASSVVVVVGDLRAMEITLPVDEMDAGKIEAGQMAVVTADAIPGKQFSGKVSGISLEGKTAGGIASFDATVLVEDQTGLLSGMTCDVKITVDSKNDTLLIPIEALQSRDNEYIVWVIPDLPSSKAGKSGGEPAVSADGSILSDAEAVTVETGLISSAYVEILSGLREGDTVLVFLKSRQPGMENMGFHTPG
jgi:HlyD family secretion protein